MANVSATAEFSLLLIMLARGDYARPPPVTIKSASCRSSEHALNSPRNNQQNGRFPQPVGDTLCIIRRNVAAGRRSSNFPRQVVGMGELSNDIA
jgi:hypothetical protein